MQSGKMRKQGLSGKRHAGHGGGHSGHNSGRVTTERDVRVGVFRQPAMQTPVLVLNASYEPINICGARRALVLVLKGVARTEEEQGCSAACGEDARGDAERDPSAGVSSDSPPDSSAQPQEHPVAGPKFVPVLQRHPDRGRADAGSCHTAVAWRAVDMGEPRRMLSQLQSAKGQPDAP